MRCRQKVDQVDRQNLLLHACGEMSNVGHCAHWMANFIRLIYFAVIIEISIPLKPYGIWGFGNGIENDCMLEHAKHEFAYLMNA